MNVRIDIDPIAGLNAPHLLPADLRNTLLILGSRILHMLRILNSVFSVKTLGTLQLI